MTRDRVKCDGSVALRKGQQFRDRKGDVWEFQFWGRHHTVREGARCKVPVFRGLKTYGHIQPIFVPVHVSTLLNKLPWAVLYVDEG